MLHTFLFDCKGFAGIFFSNLPLPPQRSNGLSLNVFARPVPYLIPVCNIKFNFVTCKTWGQIKIVVIVVLVVFTVANRVTWCIDTCS